MSAPVHYTHSHGWTDRLTHTQIKHFTAQGTLYIHAILQLSNPKHSKDMLTQSFKLHILITNAKIGPLDLSSRQPKQAQVTWVHSWKLLLWIDLLSCYSLILVYTWIYKYVYENMGMETFTINSCQVSDTWNFEYCKVAFSLPR